MATTTLSGHAAPVSTGASRIRAFGIAAAVISAAAVWVIAVSVLGVHLTVRFGNASPQTIGIGFVVGATVIASLLGWALLAVLERRTHRARAIWTIVAVAALLVSLSLPLSAGTTVSTKAILAVMHLAVASVLIPVMRRRPASQGRS